MTPRNFPPAPGWSADGRRIKVPLTYDRGPQKVWVYGALRIRDGHALTQTSRSRNTAGYLDLSSTDGPDLSDRRALFDCRQLGAATPVVRSRKWLEAHPRIQHAFIPVGAAWLNLIEGWWRIFRRKVFAGQSLADDYDIAYVTQIATEHLNRHANPWVWGRIPKPHRVLRHRFVYCL